ncbi:DUF1847 domain-containing protein [Carboxydothermus pertinax]|nr:DUF1847 domain-containing protein [Carboxydothermus pertinax]
MKTGCRYCKTTANFKGNFNAMPPNCPTKIYSEITKNKQPYLEDEITAKIMQVADQTPFDEKGKLRSRVEELVFFAKEMGYKKIGIAFCVTLINEAQKLAAILEKEGLTPILACCRLGAIDYSEIRLPKKNPEKFVSICNPIAQARLFNEVKTDLNVILGLCLGHDILFTRESQAPTTTLIVKDRVYGHNPIKTLAKIIEG